MNIALILAAGSGTRMKEEGIPKQYLDIKGKPLLTYSLETINENELIDAIVLVVDKNHLKLTQLICSAYKANKVKYIVEGGNTRQQSVYNGLKCIKTFATDDDLVMIHDAARPLIDNKIIETNISECLKYGSVTTAIKSVDTLIRTIDKRRIDSYLCRDEIYQIQTPQTFRFSLIERAHRLANKTLFDSVNDDTILIKEIGYDVYLVEGSNRYFKVTTKDDLNKLIKVLDD